MKNNYIDDLQSIESEIKNEFGKITDFSFLETSLLNNFPSESVEVCRQILLRNRKYFVNSIIISIYGFFEYFIKQISKIYINFSISREINGSRFIKKEQFESLLKLINSFSDEQQIEAVKALYDLVVKNDYSKYNQNISLYYFQNASTEKIRDLTNKIGLNTCIDYIKKDKTYLCLMQKILGSNTIDETSKILNKRENFFSEIDEIVVLRNIIAHEGHSLTIPTIDDLRNKYIPIFQTFLVAFLNAVTNYVLKSIINGKEKIMIVQDVVNNKIILFDSKNLSITKEKYVIVCETKSNYLLRMILRMESDNKAIEKTEKNQQVGCELSGYIKKNYSYRLVKKETFDY